MGRYVLHFREIDRTHVAAVGGKGAHLGDLSRADGVRVPDGFCVTTDAYRRAAAEAPSLDRRLDLLARVAPDDRDAVRALAAEIREVLEAVPVPDDVAAEIADALAAPGGEDAAYAVRSSATAEDTPTASFAGQQDSWLDVVGRDAVLRHVRRCWGSLFTERAVAYRIRQGVDHRAVRMGVVVQRMVAAEAAGVLFTADPGTGHRRVVAIEAVRGLGEALVAGTARADGWRVLDGAVVARTPAGDAPVLTDAEVVRLAALGRRVEAHFGAPQDVEWCLARGDFHVVQSRPITTLFPVPAADDDGNRVYISVGHQQMMTDAMRPLGLSFWQMTTPRPMAEAASRLFVDVTPMLASPASRDAMLAMLEKSDPLIGDALRAVLDRGDFVRAPRADDRAWVPPGSGPRAGAPDPAEVSPAVVEAMIARVDASVAALRRDIRGRTGLDLLDFIRADVEELRRLLFDPTSGRAIMTGMEAAWWLGDHLDAWLGERHAADAFAQSVPHNVTSEMGLALLDVADAIRPHPEVVARLARAGGDDGFLDALPALAGGREARDAIAGWLDAYGMRCVGEIDITRPRWSERPSALLPLLLGNVRQFAPGERARRVARGLREAERTERDVLARLRALPGGEARAAEAKRRIDQVRAFAGYREFPKFGMVRRYFVYRLALLEEAARLARAGVLRDPEDAYHLTFDELREVVRTGRADDALVRARREAFRVHQALVPPRVLTSDGEAVVGAYRRGGVPAGALAGLAVSAGVVEGRARVVRDVADADLAPGDVLVTAFTDPSWTPVFVAAAGLVTEVGGLMTHGAVVAREYGLPAVVGVERATTRIRDGQRVRVDGARGFVELLD
ncbi:phosphoenolpyruvate synthase [Roseisolibacter sp. H3M3-2]|uniref:phosphoenolpyruvate synthase n=1 Tax=Roseisolibacter sp. H3M3-2 TaxID=3031323 RepID=UPI0023DB1DC4|nr:phosphoenolpyruvate synthase [Roseisolibacter sp. H3M3-2]MDF1501930.1 phosphoenolpyruvate synthase [Roseisolibacter sp. H3M3-2]